MKALPLAVVLLLAVPACAGKTALTAEPAIAASFAGGPWLVEAIDGSAIADNSRVDITFDPGDAGIGMASGKAACNRFHGPWKQTGATIKLGPLASTMMMCTPALMVTEREFLRGLEAATTVRFDTTGAALLKGAGGHEIKLRREAK